MQCAVRLLHGSTRPIHKTADTAMYYNSLTLALTLTRRATNIDLNYTIKRFFVTSYDDSPHHLRESYLL